MNLTLKDTIGEPPMRSVFKDKGTLAFGVTKVLVTRFVGAFGFATKLDDAQLDILTVDTLEHFKHESLVDVILFFKLARTGKFGVCKSAPDSNLIFGEWMPKYLEQKAIVRERAYLQEKAIQQSTLNGDAFVKKTMLKQKALAEKREIKAQIEAMCKTMDRQMLEDTIVSWNKNKKLKQYIMLLKQKRKTILK